MQVLETAEDSMARLQRKFQNFNTKINQFESEQQRDRQTDRKRDIINS